MSEEEESQRLWAANGGTEQKAVPMWPLALILMIGAALVGFLSIPCIGLRMQYFTSAPDNSRMSVWKMQCVPDGSDCVCRQTASEIQGGDDCEMGSDLVVRCKSVQADSIR